MDYYNLLGLKRTAQAGEIRTAFRRLAKSAHPDVHPHLTGEEKIAMHRQFIELAHAYETLSDPIRRAAYDREMRTGAQGSAQGPAKASGSARASGAAGAAGSSTRRAPPRGHAAQGAPPRGRPQQSRPRGRPRRPPPPPPGSAAELDDLMQEVQGLLDKFGLDMRQQFGDTLEKALDWALTVFVEVLAALESGKEEPPKQSPPPRAASSTTASSTTASATAGPSREAPRGAPPTGKKSRPPTKPQPPSPPSLEDELAALKKQVRSSGDPYRAPTRQSVEEALRKIKDKGKKKP